MLTNEELLAEAKKRFEEAKGGNKEWRTEAKKHRDFVAGRQWDSSTKQELEDAGRPAVTFDECSALIKTIKGTLLANPMDVIYRARTGDDEALAEVYNKTMSWCRELSDSNLEESEAFGDVLVGGVGCAETYMDTDTDPVGYVASGIYVDAIQEILFDPFAKKRNLKDIRYLFRVKELSLDEFKARWPDNKARDTVFDLVTAEAVADLLIIDPTVVHVTPGNYSKEMAGVATTIDKKTALVAEYQYFKWESRYILSSDVPGETMMLEEEEFKAFARRAKGIGKSLVLVAPEELGTTEPGVIPYAKQHVKRYYRAYLTGKATVLEHTECPVNDFTYKFITGERDANKNAWFGPLRSWVDPQTLKNKVFSSTVEMVSMQSHGGLLLEEDAVSTDGLEELTANWNDPSKVVLVAPGAIQNGKIKQRDLPQFPAAHGGLLQIINAELPKISGVNVEFLGLATHNQPNVLESQRKETALTSLATYFSSLRSYRKEQGYLALMFMHRYMDNDRMLRIAGSEVAEGINKSLLEVEPSYDIIIDDTPATPNQKARTWGVLQSILPIMVQAGLGKFISPNIIKAVDLPASVAKDWLEHIAQVSQPSQEQVQEQQLRMQLLQAQIEQAKAKAQYDLMVGQAALITAQAKTGKVTGDIMAKAGKLQQEGHAHATEQMQRGNDLMSQLQPAVPEQQPKTQQGVE